jgi:CRISPR/Cas system-associated exonuclease Cas4 (RecB family)
MPKEAKTKPKKDEVAEGEPAEKKAKMRRPGPYQPGAGKQYPLSRNRIKQYMDCPRCFFLDVRHKVKPPSGAAYTLNAATDALMKREFDKYRALGEPHPLMTKYGIRAVPFRHQDLEKWRDSRQGISAVHEETQFEIYGGIDDVWQEEETGRLILADYKCTAKKDEVTDLESGFGPSYKKQIEMYQWIMRRMGFEVSPQAWFLYANGCANGEFNNRLEFRMTMISHNGDTEWIEPTLRQIKNVLEAPQKPASSETCDHCKYLTKLKELEQ